MPAFEKGKRSFDDIQLDLNANACSRPKRTLIASEPPGVPVKNKLGIKGIGEVGIVGVAGAVANTIFNATGKRIRNLPITPDKLI